MSAIFAEVKAIAAVGGAKKAEGQVVPLSGEPRIGKSRIALAEHLRTSPVGRPNQLRRDFPRGSYRAGKDPKWRHAARSAGPALDQFRSEPILRPPRCSISPSGDRSAPAPMMLQPLSKSGIDTHLLTYGWGKNASSYPPETSPPGSEEGPEWGMRTRSRGRG
jgi:hypothetical protein